MAFNRRAGAAEVWMDLLDREELARLMKAKDLSARQLSERAGWRSHAYLTRLLRGEVRTLRTDPALRIAHTLGVPVDLLFVVRVTPNAGQGDKAGVAA